MKRFLVLLTGALCLCSWLVHASAAMTIHVSRADSSFVVKLPSNPTTGYQWTLTRFDKALLNLTSQQYVAPKTRMMGAGGNALFTFQMRQGKSYPKSTTMLFSYARSWEHSSAAVTKVTVQFDE